MIDRPATAAPVHGGLTFQTLNFHPTISAHRSQQTGDNEAPPGFEAFGDSPAGGAFIDLGSQQPVPGLAPPHPAAAKPPMVSRGVMDAMLIERVEPEYPKMAQVMRLAGTVRLRAIIGTDGSVRDLEVTDGNPILARAALAAVRQWRYRPTTLNGAAVEVETYVTVQFVLQ